VVVDRGGKRRTLQRGNGGGGQEGDAAQNEAPVVPYISGCVRRAARALAPCT